MIPISIIKFIDKDMCMYKSISNSLLMETNICVCVLLGPIINFHKIKTYKIHKKETYNTWKFEPKNITMLKNIILIKTWRGGLILGTNLS